MAVEPGSEAVVDCLAKYGECPAIIFSSLDKKPEMLGEHDFHNYILQDDIYYVDHNGVGEAAPDILNSLIVKAMFAV